MVISKAVGEAILGPHHPRIRRVFEGAWERYLTMLKSAPWIAGDKRLRANIVHCAIRDLTAQEFEGVTATELIPYEPESLMTVFEGPVLEGPARLYTKWKKLDRDDLRPSNVATDQIDDMLRQLPLPGHGPHPSYPVVGYTLNKLETMIDGVYAILPLPTYNLWAYEIKANGESGYVSEEQTLWPLDDLDRTKTTIKPKRQITRKDKRAQ